MNSSLFDSIRHVNQYDAEYWSARELAKALGYTAWRNFEIVIEKAIVSSKNTGQKSKDHFAGAGKMVFINT